MIIQENVTQTFFYFVAWVLIAGWIIDRALALMLSIYKTLREFWK